MAAVSRNQMENVMTVLAALCLLAFAPMPIAAQGTNAFIAAGTPAATPYYINDSGRAGPLVMITGGVHGDEPAGACAADQIRHWPLARGRMVIVPRANVVALAAGKRKTPGETATLANLNRNFPKAKEGGPPRGGLATALWDFVRQQKPEWLVDLHEGADFNSMTNGSVGSSLIVFPAPKAKSIASTMQAAVNATITNRHRHFTLIGPPADGSLARAAGAHLGAHSMILETTIKSQPLSLRARQHRIMVLALLEQLGMSNGRLSPELMFSPDRTPGEIRVALYDADGTGGQGVPRIIELLRRMRPRTAVVRVCGADIAGGALDPFDVIIVPGGSASKEAAAIGDRGRERIRGFVENGGGYIGICAGAYLATSGFSWGLKILDARTPSPKWRRGRGLVKLELTDRGRDLLVNRDDQFECRYANGPILVPGQVENLQDYEPLAFFRTELAENDAPVGIMVNSAAIVAAHYGRGRVVCFSPHPESTPGLEDFIPRAVDWVSAGNALSAEGTSAPECPAAKK